MQFRAIFIASRYSYVVGKDKPPEHRRFGNGQPTNRGDRRKGSKNADTLLREALDQVVTVTENGKERKITKLQAGIMQLVNQAAKGDLRAFGILMPLVREINAKADPTESEPLGDEDRRFLVTMVAELEVDREGSRAVPDDNDERLRQLRKTLGRGANA